MILIDPRFGSERPGQRSTHRIVAETLIEQGAEVECTFLDYGDFMFLGNGPDGPMSIGIELKAVSDFVTSMLSGRIADRLPGFIKKYGRTYLIIEGFYRAGRKSGLVEVPRGGGWSPLRCGPRPVFWADVEKFITGIEEAGVRVRRTRTSNETARVIQHVLHSYWEKDYEEHRSFNVLYRPQGMSLVREDETTRRLRQVAACLPSIGWTRSKAVAQKFRSIHRMVTAEASEWEGIEGIGKTIKEDVQKAIHASIPGSPRAIPKSRVPARRSSPTRKLRHSQRRANTQLDAGRRTQRGVSKVVAGGREPR